MYSVIYLRVTAIVSGRYYSNNHSIIQLEGTSGDHLGQPLLRADPVRPGCRGL